MAYDGYNTLMEQISTSRCLLHQDSLSFKARWWSAIWKQVMSETKTKTNLVTKFIRCPSKSQHSTWIQKEHKHVWLQMTLRQRKVSKMHWIILNYSRNKVSFNLLTTPNTHIHEQKSSTVYLNDPFTHPFILTLQKAIDFLALDLWTNSNTTEQLTSSKSHA